MVRDDCLFVDGNGENHLSPLTSTNKQSSLTITINKQTIISHHYHQQTNNHLSPLPSTIISHHGNNHLSPLPSTNNHPLFVYGNQQTRPSTNKHLTSNKQTIISHHYHQQTNTITINKQTIISHHYHQQTNITINKQTIISHH